MKIRELFTMAFRGKGTDKKNVNEKRIAKENEQKIIQQKMAMLNGGNEQSH